MSTLREAAEPDWLDEEPFYNAMQRYRCAPREDQREIVACFEAVKRLVRAELAKPDAPAAAPGGWQLVPVEPTPQMVEAARDVKRRRLLRAVEDTKAGREPNTMGVTMACDEEWRAMLAAAPRPAPAEPQPIAAWSIVRTAESAVVTAVRAALSAAPAPQPAGGERDRYEFVLAQCREAQDIAASRGWALNDIATASTTDPRARKIATEALLSAPPQPAAQQEQAIEHCLWARNGHTRCPHQERKPLTGEQIDRHSIAAGDCPPNSQVILVSSLRRLLGGKENSHA